MTISQASLFTRARRLKSLAARPFLGVKRFDGEFQGKPFSMVVAGDANTVGYMGGLAFPGGSSVRELGYVSQFAADKLAASDADLVIVGVSHLLLPRYRAKGFDIAPRVVQMILRVYDEPDAMVSDLPGHAREDLRRNIRKMKEKNYEVELRNDDKWFDLFYHRMYRMYAENRHGDLARFCSYGRVKHDFRHGIGISLNKEGFPVAGAVSGFHGRTMVNHWKGVFEGDQAIAREGAALGLYYHRIRIAYERGCDTADWGFSPPFITDGALSHKLKWGMTPASTGEIRHIYAIIAPRESEQAIEFLRANRYYHLTESGLELSDEF